MTEQLDSRVELGKAMWIAQADGFFNCVKANGIESAEDLAALFAGFMASATGAMIGSAGPTMAMQVLGAVSKSCAAQTVEQYMAKSAPGASEPIPMKTSLGQSTGYTAVDMATAAAEGFRDGVASVTGVKVDG